MQFEKTKGQTSVSSGISSGCQLVNYPSNSLRGKVSTSIPNYLPVGDGSTTPFHIRFEFFQQDLCAGSPHVVDLNNGLKTNSSQAKYITIPSVVNSQKLYFKLGKSEICKGSSLTTEFAGGSGGVSTPNLICTENQLYNIFPTTTVVNNYLDKAGSSYKLLADIDLSDNPVTGSGFSPPWESCVDPGSNFMPIGRTYDGTTCATANIPDANFDGNGHFIKGLKINNSQPLSTGFYGTLSAGGQHRIQRLTFKDSFVIGVGSTGTVVGGATNTHFRHITLQNPTVTSPLNDNIGGMVGVQTAGSIQNIYISNLNLTGREGVGGVVGTTAYAGSSPSLTKSFVSGTVNGGSYIGGLVGFSNSGTSTILTTLSKSRFTGTINVSGQFIGGLIGWGDTTRVEDSYAQTNFNSSFAGTVRLGGIVGYLRFNNGTGDGGVYSSYALSSVTDICGSSSLCYIGEVVGSGDGSYLAQDFETTVYVPEAVPRTTPVVGSPQPLGSFLDSTPGWLKLSDGSSLMGLFLPDVWEFSDTANPKLVDEP